MLGGHCKLLGHASHVPQNKSWGVYTYGVTLRFFPSREKRPAYAVICGLLALGANFFIVGWIDPVYAGASGYPNLLFVLGIRKPPWFHVQNEINHVIIRAFSFDSISYQDAIPGNITGRLHLLECRKVPYLVMSRDGTCHVITVVRAVVPFYDFFPIKSRCQ